MDSRFFDIVGCDEVKVDILLNKEAANGFRLHIFWTPMFSAPYLLKLFKEGYFLILFTHCSCNRVAMKLYVKTHFKHKWDLRPTNFFNIIIHYGYDIFLKTLF